MTQHANINHRSAREQKVRLHRRLVLAQLTAVGALVWSLAHNGLGVWSLVFWLLAVTLMLLSIAVQTWWRTQDSTRIQPANRETPAPAFSLSAGSSHSKVRSSVAAASRSV